MNINLRRVRSQKVGRAILYASFIKHLLLFIVFIVQGWVEMSVMGAMMLVFVSVSIYFENINKRKLTFFLMFAAIISYWAGSEILLGTQYGYHHVIWPLIVVMVLLDVLDGRPLYLCLLVCVGAVIASTFLPEQGLLIAEHTMMPLFNMLYLVVSCLILIPVMIYFHRSNLFVLNKLREQANTDTLTGLYNRRRMLEDINLQQALCERNNGKFSLILADIDFFKKLNDSYGHGAGDAALESLSKLLKNTVRKTDSVSRWGGEEFLILLSGSDAKEAYKIANTLRELIANQPIKYQDRHLHLTLSFGVANYKIGQTIEQTINNADMALYQAKVQGRNRVVLHRPSITVMPEPTKANEKYFASKKEDVEPV
ncbi:MAG: GGDEF domain-containing protein [Saccharospirillaceae bacterium]|nr:GGDEF domain-containing protein [Pseudomonadales bacterium]NRB81884.1 GGDEF domain-containing protein [Saccharospirillaceae bacterium]